MTRAIAAPWAAPYVSRAASRIDTSGPILRQAGFAAYGQETLYRVPLA